MKLIEKNYYFSDSTEEVEVIDDIKYVFGRMVEINKEIKSNIILFYIDGVNGNISVGFANEDSSYLGESLSIRFIKVMESNGYADGFTYDIMNGMVKSVLSIKESFESNLKYYYSTEMNLKMVEISERLLKRRGISPLKLLSIYVKNGFKLP